MTVRTSPRVSGPSVAFAAAALALGQTIVLAFPDQRNKPLGGAIALATMAAILAACGLFFHARLAPRVQRIASRVLLSAAVAYGLYRLPMWRLYIDYPAARNLLAAFVLMSLLAAGLSLMLLLDRPRRWMTSVFLILLFVHGCMGYWWLRFTYEPFVDVYAIQKLSCEALTQHQNPYAITFPDRYGEAMHYYPPGLVKNGRVQSGYVYPPCSLLLMWPSYLAGDVRYTDWIAFTLAAALLGFLRPASSLNEGERRDFAPAVALLFLPKIFPLLANAWFEPLLLAMLIAAMFVAVRGKAMACAALLGLFFCAKQYSMFALPVVPFLFAPGTAKQWAQRASLALGVGSLITLPFILWSPPAFFHSLTDTMVGVIRPDSVSYLPALAAMTGHRFSLVFTALIALPIMALVAWRAPRSAFGFAGGLLLIFLCVFLFSTQSFVNYFILAAGLALAAAGANGGGGVCESSEAGTIVA